jgi:hypothetical protein
VWREHRLASRPQPGLQAMFKTDSDHGGQKSATPCSKLAMGLRRTPLSALGPPLLQVSPIQAPGSGWPPLVYYEPFFKRSVCPSRGGRDMAIMLPPERSHRKLWLRTAACLEVVATPPCSHPCWVLGLMQTGTRSLCGHNVEKDPNSSVPSLLECKHLGGEDLVPDAHQSPLLCMAGTSHGVNVPLLGCEVQCSY